MKLQIIKDKTDSITKYFKEVNETELLSIDQEVELTNRIKNGDKSAINELIKANLKFVIKIAKEYQGLGLPLSDLISEGNYGLIKATTKFDSTRGFRFISYAVYWIKQSIIQSLNDNSRTIRLPTNIINKLYQINKKNKTNIDFSDDDNNYPTCVSLNSCIRNSDGESELINFIEDEGSENFEIFELEVSKLKQAINNTLSILDERERGIIECYYGLNYNCEPMTLEAIGDKYNLTKERIRQIKDKSIRRLRHNNDELYLLLNK